MDIDVQDPCKRPTALRRQSSEVVVCCMVKDGAQIESKTEVGLRPRAKQLLPAESPSTRAVRSLSPLSPHTPSVHLHRRPQRLLPSQHHTCNSITPATTSHLQTRITGCCLTHASTVICESSSYQTRVGSHGDCRRCSHRVGAVHT